MPILNYTTRIPVSQTVEQIQRILLAHGAREMHFQYDERGHVTALVFSIRYRDSMLNYQLPANAGAVLRVMQTNRRSHSRANEEQAQRVAWRIVKDWLEAQMAILEAGLADIKQVFLPYMLNASGQTLYEVVEGKGFLLSEGRG